MANTGKDASGNTIFLRKAFGNGVDDTNAYNYGTAVYFARNGIEQLVTLDTATPANNRPLPVIFCADSGVLATIKVASTPAVATDTAIVVTNRDGIKPVPYTLINRSGTTSATIGTKTQVSSANTNRQGLTIENRSATDTLTIFVGAAALEVDVPTGILPPGSANVFNVFQTGSTDRFAISSTGVSTAYVATEGVYS